MANNVTDIGGSTNPTDIDNITNGFHICSCKGGTEVEIVVFLPNACYDVVTRMLGAALSNQKGTEPINIDVDDVPSLMPVEGYSSRMFTIRTVVNESCRKSGSFMSNLMLPIPVRISPSGGKTGFVKFVSDNVLSKSANGTMMRLALSVASDSQTDTIPERTDTSLVLTYVRTITEMANRRWTDIPGRWTGLTAKKVDTPDVSAVIPEKIEVGETLSAKTPQDRNVIDLLVNKNGENCPSERLTMPGVFIDTGGRLYYNQELSGNLLDGFEIGGTGVPLYVTVDRAAVIIGTDDGITYEAGTSIFAPESADPVRYSILVNPEERKSTPLFGKIDRQVRTFEIVTVNPDGTATVAPDADGLAPGMVVQSLSGTTFPANTTIQSISGNIVTFSENIATDELDLPANEPGDSEYVIARKSYERSRTRWCVAENTTDILNLYTPAVPMVSSGMVRIPAMVADSEILEVFPISRAYFVPIAEGSYSFRVNNIVLTPASSVDTGFFMVEEDSSSETRIAGTVSGAATAYITSPVHASGGMDLKPMIMTRSDSPFGTGVSYMWIIGDLFTGSSTTPVGEIEEFIENHGSGFFGNFDTREAEVLHAVCEEAVISVDTDGSYVLEVPNRYGINLEELQGPVGWSDKPRVFLAGEPDGALPEPRLLDRSYIINRWDESPVSIRYRITFSDAVSLPGDLAENDIRICLVRKGATCLIRRNSSEDSLAWAIGNYAGKDVAKYEYIRFPSGKGYRVMNTVEIDGLSNGPAVLHVFEGTSGTPDPDAYFHGNASLGNGSSVPLSTESLRIVGTNYRLRELAETGKEYIGFVSGNDDIVRHTALYDPGFLDVPYARCGLVAGTNVYNLPRIAQSPVDESCLYPEDMSTILSAIAGINESADPIIESSGFSTATTYLSDNTIHSFMCKYSITGIEQDPVPESSMVYYRYSELASPTLEVMTPTEGSMSLVNWSTRASVDADGYVTGLLGLSMGSSVAYDAVVVSEMIRSFSPGYLSSMAGMIERSLMDVTSLDTANIPRMWNSTLPLGITRDLYMESDIPSILEKADSADSDVFAPMLDILSSMRSITSPDGKAVMEMYLSRMSELYSALLVLRDLVIPSETVTDAGDLTGNITLPVRYNSNIVGLAFDSKLAYAGLWYYNLRKAMLLSASMVDMVLSYLARIICIITGITHNLSMVVGKNIDPVKVKFEHYAFMSGATPMYPVLKQGTTIENSLTPRLNSVSLLFPEKTLTYSLKMTIPRTIMEDTIRCHPQIMPGFGMETVPGDQSFFPESILPKEAGSETTGLEDIYDSYGVLPRYSNPLRTLSNHVKPDFIEYVDDSTGQIYDDTGLSTPVTLSKYYKSVCNGTDIQVPEIKSLVVTGTGDMSYVIPYLTEPICPTLIPAIDIDANYKLGYPGTLEWLFANPGQGRTVFDIIGDPDSLGDAVSNMNPYESGYGSRVTEAAEMILRRIGNDSKHLYDSESRRNHFRIPFIGNANPILSPADGESGLVYANLVSQGLLPNASKSEISARTISLMETAKDWIEEANTPARRINYNINLSKRRAYLFAMNVARKLIGMTSPVPGDPGPRHSFKANRRYSVIVNMGEALPDWATGGAYSVVTMHPFRAYGVGALFNSVTDASEGGSTVPGQAYQYGRSTCVYFSQDETGILPTAIKVNKNGIDYIDGIFSVCSGNKETFINSTSPVISNPGYMRSVSTVKSTTESSLTYYTRLASVMTSSGLVTTGTGGKLEPEVVKDIVSGFMNRSDAEDYIGCSTGERTDYLSQVTVHILRRV